MRQAENIQNLISNLQNEVNSLNNVIAQKNSEIANLNNVVSSLNNEIQDKKSQIINLDEESIMQDFGLYQPIYDFAKHDQLAAGELIHNTDPRTHLRTQQPQRIRSRLSGRRYHHHSIRYACPE